MAPDGATGGPARSRGRRLAPFVLLVCLLLAGCSVGYTGTPSPSPDPDRIGYEDGYAANATLSVTPEDGLNDTELAAVVARTTARVERIRGAEFDGNLTVETLTREEYRARNLSFTPREDRAADARWEAALLVGEDAASEAVVSDLFGGAVAGYYLPGENRLVLVGEVNTRTLAHELVHALQDARGWDVSRRATLDGRLAGRGLTEGEAVAVQRAYAARCGSEWDCLPLPPRGDLDVDAVVAHPGVYLVFRAPYVLGPEFVGALRERGGWDAVNDAYADPPTATRELLDPAAYPAASPEVAIADRSTRTWERYGGADSLGRATVHATFWRHNLVARGDDAVATDYRDRYTDGLVADRFRAYRNGDADGYVWRLRFANASEAAEFAAGYERLLRLRLNARAPTGDVFVVESGPFADAFRVTRDGDAVTIVNAPALGDLSAVHAREGVAA
ncbi:Hvo_1808 family surface protein [Halosegnis marinus]|uniref:Hvo_1808 family surface protein n=1 Tax=Halosegnis marinus TaxID=3034023 RepID=A0ABD5ZNG3_9EURY|nr:Hvo_1808 family surface protein [Halosegnis sp. DT85]